MLRERQSECVCKMEGRTGKQSRPEVSGDLDGVEYGTLEKGRGGRCGRPRTAGACTSGVRNHSALKYENCTLGNRKYRSDSLGKHCSCGQAGRSRGHAGVGQKVARRLKKRNLNCWCEHRRG